MSNTPEPVDFEEYCDQLYYKVLSIRYARRRIVATNPGSTYSAAIEPLDYLQHSTPILTDS